MSPQVVPVVRPHPKQHEPPAVPAEDQHLASAGACQRALCFSTPGSTCLISILAVRVRAIRRLSIPFCKDIVLPSHMSSSR